MKSSRLMVLVVTAIALASFGAQAAGLDVAGFFLARADMLAGLSMLGMAGSIETEYREVTANLEKVGAQIKAFRDTTKADTEALSARVHALEVVHAQAANRSRGVVSQGGRTGIAGLVIQDQLAELSGLQQLAQSGRGTVTAHAAGLPLASLVNGGKGSSSDGTIASNAERSGIFADPFRPLTLLDLLPSRPTDRDAVEHVRLIPTGDANAQELEGDEKAEIELDSVLIKAEISTVAAHATLSRQVLTDHVGLGEAVDGLLSGKVRSKLESLMVNGSGSSGEFEGLVACGTPFTPTSWGGLVDCIGEALVDMRDEGFEPGLIVVNPGDWFAQVQIPRDLEGRYLFGSPLSPAQGSLWQVPVAQTPSLAAGQFIVLDLAYVTILDRQQLQVLLSEHHKDNFTRNLITMLAELRVGLEVRHSKAVRIATWTAVPPSSSTPPASS